MISSVVNDMVAVLHDGSSRLVALGIALALTLSGATRAFLETSVYGVGSFPMPGDNVLMLVSTLLICALVSHWHRLAARLLCTRAGGITVSAFALLSVALLQVCHQLPADQAASLLFFAGVLVRLAGLIALMALCAWSSLLPCGALMAHMGWGFAIAIALDLVFLLLAPAGVAVVGMILPFALAAILLRLCAVIDAAVLAAADPSVRVDLPASEDKGAVSSTQPHSAPLPRGRLAIFVLYGVVGGLASSQAHTLGQEVAGQSPSIAQTCLVNDAGLLAGVVLLLLGAAWLIARKSEPFVLRYLLLPAYLVAIFLSPLLSGVFGVAVPVLMAISQVLFYGLLWAFPQTAPASERLRWFAAACGAFFTGTYAGMCLGGDVLRVLNVGDIYMVAAAVALAVLLMVELLPRMIGASDAGADALDPAAAPEAPVVEYDPAAGLDALVACAAQSWGLTPRERAVLPGLLRGRSVAWVAESLTVSKNTVHTHMRNIYQKAGVHSQEELIDAAEALQK